MANLEQRAQSKLFEPLNIANGKIQLKHRIVLAPLTRNRGEPYDPSTTRDKPNRLWYPGEMMAEYYRQRATDGGLLITEGIPPSLEGGGMPGVCGLFLPEQVAGWKTVVDAVHSRGGVIYAQLWHAGRATLTPFTGLPTFSPSGLPWDDPEGYHSRRPLGTDTPVKYRDHPSVAMTAADIQRTIGDYAAAAKRAVEECGFDGVEVHGGNGYLPEQFLSSNINVRTDSYGGSPAARCEFLLELMDVLAATVGQENVAVRLSPFGLYNQTRGAQRMETWTHLCRELKTRLPRMSYVSFIEPRYEQVFSTQEKDAFLASWGLSTVDLSYFRGLFGDDIPLFSAGGWNDSNAWGVLESGAYDALLFGRLFISNPDLPTRLRDGRPLRPYDRRWFYGPFEDNARGYIDYTAWAPEDDDDDDEARFEEKENQKKTGNTADGLVTFTGTPNGIV